jgi:hypothetical protein
VSFLPIADDYSDLFPNRRAIIEMISTIIVYRFTNLTRTEVEAMIGITLQQTRVYQDAKAEGVNRSIFDAAATVTAIWSAIIRS